MDAKTKNGGGGGATTSATAHAGGGAPHRKSSGASVEGGAGAHTHTEHAAGHHHAHGGGHGGGGASAHDAGAAHPAPATTPYTLPIGPDTGGSHCWSRLDATTFQVRGPNYITDHVKVAAGPALFSLQHADLLACSEKLANVASRSDSWLRRAREGGDTRYYLVIVYITPVAPFMHVIFYFAVDDAKLAGCKHASKLWTQFTAHGAEADAFRNERWKVIPRVAEGSWVVQRAVGAKPALLAQKLTHTWVLCDGVNDVVDPAGGGGRGAASPPPPPGARGGWGWGGGRGGSRWSPPPAPRRTSKRTATSPPPPWRTSSCPCCKRTRKRW